MNITPRVTGIPVPKPSAQLNNTEVEGHITAARPSTSGASEVGQVAISGYPPESPEHQPSARSQASQAERTVLNRVLMKLADVDARDEAVRRTARTRLDDIASERLQFVRSRGVSSRNPVLLQKHQEEARQAREFADFYHPLFARVTGLESGMKLLAKFARENERIQLLTYRPDKTRDLFEMVTEKDGDCETYAGVFKRLAEVMGVEDVGLHHMDKAMSVPRAEIPGATSSSCSDRIEFARHTILECRDAENRVEHFDPVFGRAVDPEFYGEDLDRYLKREAPVV